MRVRARARVRVKVEVRVKVRVTVGVTRQDEQGKPKQTKGWIGPSVEFGSESSLALRLGSGSSLVG